LNRGERRKHHTGQNCPLQHLRHTLSEVHMACGVVRVVLGPR
jgi:hypothetical protein